MELNETKCPSLNHDYKGTHWEVGTEGLGVWDQQSMTKRMDKQQSPTAQHRGLYLVKSRNGKGCDKEGMCMYN